MRYVVLSLLLLFAAIAVFAQGDINLPAEVYTTRGPHVVVNGMLLNAPVKEVRGSLLLPMRAVFEALEAEVKWFPATQLIVATRGNVTVQLWINRSVAIVNEQEINLAVPPTLMQGSTYVPLRFPAEAFGGEVKWFGNIQTAVISITPLVAIIDPVTPVIPVVPDPAAPTMLNGVLVTKVTEGVTALLVQNAKGDTSLLQITPTAVITRANGQQTPQIATFTALEPGDQLQITLDAAGKATAIVARFAQIKGIAAAVANNKLLLQDGALYQLQPDIRVLDTNGKVVPLTQVSNGVAVTLDLTPDTTNVWRIIVPVQTIAPIEVPVVRLPMILTVAAVGYTKALKTGDILTIQVTGEPKAESVTASVGDIIRDLKLTETTPGTYTRKVTIAANTNATAVPIVAVMQLAGKKSEAVKSVLPVTIDTRAPSFNVLIPGDGTQLLDRNPTLEAAYSDPGGSGIDAKSIKVWVNGVDVSKLATITDTRLSYKAKNLANGPLTAHIEMADLAGNTASADWKMTITPVAVAVAANQYLKHDAIAPLMAGQKLSLRAKLARTPFKLEWYLGNKLISIEKLKDVKSNEYLASYTIDEADALGENSVSVRLYSTARDSQVLFSTTQVTLVAKPKEFMITAPANNTKAAVPLVITGEATAGAQVRVTVTYTAQVLFFVQTGELYKAILTTDTHGVWKTPGIDSDFALVQPDTYNVTAELLDKDGLVTKTEKITLKRK